MVGTDQTDSNLVNSIRNVPDFPKPGIVFRDITTLLKDKVAFNEVIDIFYEHYRKKEIAKVVGVESRGFIFGAALAYTLGAGFVPIRKPNKLPAEVLREEYQLEYGTDAVEIHVDAIATDERVLVVDDLLATGGTILAATKLVERLGGKIVSLAFLIELSFLQARARLSPYDIFSIVKYDSE
jgi:adenine phosphoribosyltransferase